MRSLLEHFKVIKVVITQSNTSKLKDFLYGLFFAETIL